MDKGQGGKTRWVKWFWSDWSSDWNLRACSLAARGLWMEMLAIMNSSNPRGYLVDICSKPEEPKTQNLAKLETQTLAKLVGESVDRVEELLEELRVHGVFSETVDGVIYNRRMERESRVSFVRTECGSLGGAEKVAKRSKTLLANPNDANSDSVQDSSSSLLFSSLSLEEGDVGGGKATRIEYDFDGRKWDGIDEEQMAFWAKIYPAVDIRQELANMAGWLDGNPNKRKKNYKRFISGWLSRVQDRGGTKSNSESFFDRGSSFNRGKPVESLPPREVFTKAHESRKSREEADRLKYEEWRKGLIKPEEED